MRIFLLLLFVVVNATASAQVDLKPGMKITSSVTIRNALYPINAPDASGKVSLESTPVIEISGNNIVVDFNYATLKGSNDKQLPDEFYGVALRIKAGKNITIKNLFAKGYKVALMATDVEGLVLENCDFSYNYRQHLNSTQEKEDISDWMSYHQNEKDEWLRYGAAMYLRNCNNSKIYKNTVTGGQCALMMTQCNNGLIYNNNFSFNSAIGIGMYRSSKNRVMYNKLDWNVRGHSEGVYNRGQDSAAILVFEQCNENIFAYNSATHSGDGFFLWAGQTTMDTGEGGCNDNLIFGNDFSYAPTNGIEVTFSRNRIAENTVIGCDHGIWGGYSYDTDIRRNIFRNNRIAIAIEHGQKNDIIGNWFTGNKESIRLWARKQQPADWGYAQKRDTRSMEYGISGNRFEDEGIVYNIIGTSRVELYANRKYKSGTTYKLDSISTVDSSMENEGSNNILRYEDIPEINDGMNASLPANHPRGRDEIRITEWGPYDFNYPLLWRTNPLDTSGLLQFEVMTYRGLGKWKVIKSKGVEGISKSAGGFWDTLSARRLKGYIGDIFIEMEYIPKRSGVLHLETPVTQFGEDIPFDKPYKFAFRDARIQMHWKTSWFNYDSLSNPVRDTSFIKRLGAGEPFMSRSVNDLNFAWWGGLSPAQGKKPFTQFLTVAESDVDLEYGEYELSVTWDDAVRVILDGKLILNEWNPSLYKFDESPNRRIKLKLGGKHHFRVEHAELGGFATIGVRLKKL